MEEQNTVPVDNDNFGAVLNCAVRYACGRETYMPYVVTSFITPLLGRLTNRTLWCFDQDLTEAAYMGGYGHPRIDKPTWLEFHDRVREELTRRGCTLYHSFHKYPPPEDLRWGQAEGGKRGIEARTQNAEEFEWQMRKVEKTPLGIRINLHGNPLPVITNGDWIDLYTAEEVAMKPLEYRAISLGVSMELPEGYYAHLAPRSSACQKYGILMGNSLGIIDSNYNGDEDIWRFPAVAIRETAVPKGVRICQFRLERCPEPVVFEVTDHLGNPSRGGLGSTGER